MTWDFRKQRVLKKPVCSRYTLPDPMTGILTLRMQMKTYKPLPVLFWLGKKFNIDACIIENHRLLKKSL